MRTTTTLLLALAMMIAPLGTVGAQQGEKSYETDVSEDRATITIERMVDQRTITNEITFDTEDGAFTTVFDYENASEEASTRLGLTMHQLVEYRDTNDNDRYDADDEVASAWRLSQGSENVTADSNGTLSWDALETKNVTADDGTEGTRIDGVARFPSQDPVQGVLEQLGQGENRTVRVSIYVFGEPVTLDGTHLSAMEVKIDLTVKNYPYTRNGTALALASEATAQRPLSLSEDGDNASLGVSREVEGVTIDLAFAWSEQARVDGELTDVGVTQLEGNASQAEANETDAPDEGDEGSEQLFALSYARGEEIVHDPKLGATATVDEGLLGSAQEEASSVPGMTAWAALLGVLGAAALVRSRR